MPAAARAAPARDPIGAVMLVRVWEYEVAPDRAAEFEQVYGPAGAWAQLFAASPGYLGTELYRAVGRPGRYLTVDRFSDAAAWQQFSGEHGAEYAELDSRCAHLTTSQLEIQG
jgi:heme-degrading monooxygenase HmoA